MRPETMSTITALLVSSGNVVNTIVWGSDGHAAFENARLCCCRQAEWTRCGGGERSSARAAVADQLGMNVNIGITESGRRLRKGKG